jgi:hypothetical protein
LKKDHLTQQSRNSITPKQISRSDTPLQAQDKQIGESNKSPNVEPVSDEGNKSSHGISTKGTKSTREPWPSTKFRSAGVPPTKPSVMKAIQHKNASSKAPSLQNRAAERDDHSDDTESLIGESGNLFTVIL